MSFETLDAAKFYGWPAGSQAFNPATHKVVPKDAVVLHLDEPPLSWWRGAKDLREYADSMVEGRTGYAAEQLIRHLADQIEAHTKPPRIEEPGLYSVYRNGAGEDWFHAGPNEYTSHAWVNTHTFENADWVDIPGPLKPIREGV